jgi:hypothetical protein
MLHGVSVANGKHLSEDPAPDGAVSGTRGLFDGFEGYVTPTPEDYGRVLTQGVVVPDANVLLNLYRYTAEARDDLLAVLDRLGDRLWVPHQVLFEFWQNRESVLRDPRDTAKTVQELTAHRERALAAFRTWANRVSLPAERSRDLLGSLNEAFDAVMSGIDEFADTRAVEAARDTHKDPVLRSLESMLRNRVGLPLGDEAHAAAVVEGLRRVAEREPPGYMDKKKDDEGAAGDYLVWEQVLIEAKRRRCDVLFVTGDVKEDWWREEHGERRGPRIELVNEMRQRSGRQLFMLRPTQLLDYARTALEVTVREESVQDVDRVDKFLSESQEVLPGGGWDVESLSDLLEKLDVEAPVQARVVRTAAGNDGFISRDLVYKIGRYSEDRSLRGFTRPISRIAQMFRDGGTIPEGAVDILWAVYNEDSPNAGWAAGFRVHEDVLPLFSELTRASTEPKTSTPG